MNLFDVVNGVLSGLLLSLTDFINAFLLALQQFLSSTG